MANATIHVDVVSAEASIYSGEAEFVASVDSASVPPQPFAVEEVSTRQLERQASAPEAFDRLPVEPFSGLAIAEECLRPGLDAERQLGARRAGPLGQGLDRGRRDVGLATARRGLHQLGQ